MIIYKFGGATTRTAKGLETLVRITSRAFESELARAKRQRTKGGKLHGLVIVVSAIGHTTRNLRKAGELSEAGNLNGAEEQLKRISASHLQLAQSLKFSERGLAKLQKEFDSITEGVHALCEGISITLELSPRILDSVLAAGEQYALALIAQLLRERELPLTTIPATEIIVTNETFNFASPLLEETADKVRARVLPVLHKSHIALTQGFVGATRDGITTTMGSESSDLTATILARVLGAEEVVIWKNVSGMFTADPDIIPNSKLLRSLSFTEAEEIGRRGARVLFQSAAEPLRNLERAALLRIASPNSPGKSTTLYQYLVTDKSRSRALALALEEHLVPIKLVHRPVSSTDGGSSKRREANDAALVKNSLYVWNSERETTLLIKKEAKNQLSKMISKTRYEVMEEIPVSAISLILRNSDKADIGEITQQFLKSLKGFKVKAFFPARHSLVALVEESQGKQAFKSLHKVFFGS